MENSCEVDLSKLTIEGLVEIERGPGFVRGKVAPNTSYQFLYDKQSNLLDLSLSSASDIKESMGDIGTGLKFEAPNRILIGQASEREDIARILVYRKGCSNSNATLLLVREAYNAGTDNTGNNLQRFYWKLESTDRDFGYLYAGNNHCTPNSLKDDFYYNYFYHSPRPDEIHSTTNSNGSFIVDIIKKRTLDYHEDFGSEVGVFNLYKQYSLEHLFMRHAFLPGGDQVFPYEAFYGGCQNRGSELKVHVTRHKVGSDYSTSLWGHYSNCFAGSIESKVIKFICTDFFKK